MEFGNEQERRGALGLEPAAALKAGAAIFEQVQVDELLLDMVAVWVFERLDDFIEQEVGEALAGAVEGLADACGCERLGGR